MARAYTHIWIMRWPIDLTPINITEHMKDLSACSTERYTVSLDVGIGRLSTLICEGDMFCDSLIRGLMATSEHKQLPFKSIMLAPHFQSTWYSIDHLGWLPSIEYVLGQAVSWDP